MMSNSIRRCALVLVLLAAVVCESRAASVGWTDFLGIFVSGDGRVVDTGNGNISHSEGQGYGMLLAVANGDAAAFARIWNWTQKNTPGAQRRLARMEMGASRIEGNRRRHEQRHRR